MPWKDPEVKKRWLEANRDRLRQKSRDGYYSKREEILARKKADRLANPEKYIEETRRNYARNKEKIAARFKIRYKANPQYYKDIAKRYTEKIKGNPETRAQYLLSKRERRLLENYGMTLEQY